MKQLILLPMVFFAVVSAAFSQTHHTQKEKQHGQLALQRKQLNNWRAGNA